MGSRREAIAVVVMNQHTACYTTKEGDSMVEIVLGVVAILLAVVLGFLVGYW